ncbi:hypothetical protein FA15DRAFT_601852, partial [Coprinopsis marcescibilis]
MSNSSRLEFSKGLLDPRLLPFLDNNAPVPGHLSHNVVDTVEAILTSINALEDDIIPIQQKLDKMKRLRDVMYREHTMVSALKSPIREVPSELIASIMELTLFSDRGMLDSDGRADFCSLRAVSRQWREVGLTTPSLWARLKVELDARAGRLGGPKFDWPGRLSRWFDRAGRGLPLGIEL